MFVSCLFMAVDLSYEFDFVMLKRERERERDRYIHRILRGMSGSILVRRGVG